MKKPALILVFLSLLLAAAPVSAQTQKTAGKPGAKSTGKGSGKNSGKSSGGAGYQTGIGLRGGGYASGLTVKHFMGGKNNVAIEGLLTTEYYAKGARLTVLLEKHFPLLPEVKNLQWYVGGGMHLGAYRRYNYYTVGYRLRGKKHKDYYYVQYYGDDKLYPVFGADLVLGLEYKIDDLPLTVGVDYKPYFDIYDGASGLYNDAALNVRFTF
ncbi:hypothetical protein [Hymenobacter sp. B81]|uniref:hypothetical protein n=1 Tax=Hymenobacter sp. B81 TaxID=3344878 RepID=UPI0037DD2EB4